MRMSVHHKVPNLEASIPEACTNHLWDIKGIELIREQQQSVSTKCISQL